MPKGNLCESIIHIDSERSHSRYIFQLTGSAKTHFAQRGDIRRCYLDSSTFNRALLKPGTVAFCGHDASSIQPEGRWVGRRRFWSMGHYRQGRSYRPPMSEWLIHTR